MTLIKCLSDQRVLLVDTSGDDPVQLPLSMITTEHTTT
jgi:hypothetical protein